MNALSFVIRVEQNDRADARANEVEEISMKRREAAVKRKQEAMKERETAMKQKQEAMKERESALVQREADVTERETAVKDAEPLLVEIEARETAVAILETSMKKLNPLAQDVIYMIGGREDTGSAIAKRHNKSTGYVSKIKASMNGAG